MSTTSDFPASTGGALGERMRTLHSASVAATRGLGIRLGKSLAPGDVVLLSGPLGAGKTALAQGIGAGLDVRGPINSPTFTILKQYRGRLPLYHFDLYRIEDPNELYSLGFEDYFGGAGVCVVEWAERGEQPTTGDAPWGAGGLRIALRALGPRRRELVMTAHDVRAQNMLAALARTAGDKAV